MEIEQFAQAWVHAMNQRDIETLRGIAHPEIEVHFAELSSGGVWGGDFKQVYSGVDEAMEALEQWSEPWSELRLELDRVEPEEEDRFIVFATWHGVGRGSGIVLRASNYIARYTLRDGQVWRIRFLSEPPRRVEQPSA